MCPCHGRNTIWIPTVGTFCCCLFLLACSSSMQNLNRVYVYTLDGNKMFVHVDLKLNANWKNGHRRTYNVTFFRRYEDIWHLVTMHTLTHTQISIELVLQVRYDAIFPMCVECVILLRDYRRFEPFSVIIYCDAFFNMYSHTHWHTQSCTCIAFYWIQITIYSWKNDRF